MCYMSHLITNYRSKIDSFTSLKYQELIEEEFNENSPLEAGKGGKDYKQPEKLLNTFSQD